MTTSENPIIGTSLLPEGTSLPDYIQKVRDITYQALKDFRVGTDEYVEIYIMSRCLNALGWNTSVEHEKASLSDGRETSYSVEYALRLDDGNVVSINGDLGWEALHARVEAEAYQALNGRNDNDWMGQRYKAANPLCPMIWSISKDIFAVHEREEIRFHQSPASADVIGQIVSELSKELIQQNTASVSADKARGPRL